LAAVLGGTQSLHTNGFDEALGLPTENAAQIALRTQQIIAFESGAADTADPLGGSYYVESLTNSIESKAWELIQEIDDMGGSVEAIENGYMQEQIAASAYQQQREIEKEEKRVVGVNCFTTNTDEETSLLKVSDNIRNEQIEKINKIKANRNESAVQQALQHIDDAIKNGINMMPSVIEAVEKHATLGEISDLLRSKFGEHR
jgi:methylmalonyl-CoA mutase N-terminal domain/subunit